MIQIHNNTPYLKRISKSFRSLIESKIIFHIKVSSQSHNLIFDTFFKTI